MLRSFIHQGTEWTVWDTRPQLSVGLDGRLSVADGFTEGWLTFQCDAEKRRLVPVPVQWFELNEAQLAALLNSAAPVRRAPDQR